MARQYKTGGTTSSIDKLTGKQLTEFMQKKALSEAKKEQFFSQLADTTAMPKHHGKKIIRYVYIPLLSDENMNDEGIDATGATSADGNLYASSKDIGAIQSKIPTLSENGGRVNRVGFSRKTIEGTFENFGFFSDYTEDSVNLDSDPELMEHINRETITGASEISEDVLQIDIIQAAGVIKFTGVATAITDVKDVVTFNDLLHLSIDLDDNRTPKDTKIVTGTRLTDTKTISACRVMFCGSEMIPVFEAMKDLHGKAAFTHLDSYLAGTTALTGERGRVGDFRVVIVPEMVKWEGGGATEIPGFYATGGKMDVFPLLVVGSGSFTTIGFLTDGKTVKFKQIHKKPGVEIAGHDNPYGKKGFMSISWWYGFMPLRPERIALIQTAASM